LRLRVSHTTSYTYLSPATESYNEARLMPLSDRDQTCLGFRLTTNPISSVFSYQLPTGIVHHFAVRTPHMQLRVAAESNVETHHHDPFAELQLIESDSRFYSSESTREKYIEYLLPTTRVQLHEETDRIAAVAQRHADPGTAAFLVSLMGALHRVLLFRPGVTDVDSTITEVLEHGSGVCQDFTHLMLAVCRRQGIPARYVSGYLYTGDVAGIEEHKAETAAELLGGDAMHAWAECLMPDGTWAGFDPANNLLTDEHYIKVHYGRDYGDVAPLRGVYRGPAADSMIVAVKVTAELPGNLSPTQEHRS
jgi:transglutaminase-like putative cysteine protease